MQRARHQFLARARLAGNQHGRMRLREPSDGAEHLLHRRRLPEDFRRGFADFDGAFLLHALFHCAADEFHRVIDVERLGQILVGAALKRADRAFEIGIRRHDDDRQVRVVLLRFLQQLEARSAGHADVAHHHLRRFGIKRGERILRRSKRLECDVLARERFFEHPADRAIVVDNPDRFHKFSER